MSAHNWDKDYTKDYVEEENKRESRLHTRQIKMVMEKLRRALRMEVSRGELSPPLRDRFIMSPLEFLSKSFIRINLETLYRRYRQIRIQALTECLAIVGQGETREENLESIRKIIIQCGEAHKASQQREESKDKKCAGY